MPAELMLLGAGAEPAVAYRRVCWSLVMRKFGVKENGFLVLTTPHLVMALRASISAVKLPALCRQVFQRDTLALKESYE